MYNYVVTRAHDYAQKNEHDESIIIIIIIPILSFELHWSLKLQLPPLPCPVVHLKHCLYQHISPLFPLPPLSSSSPSLPSPHTLPLHTIIQFHRDNFTTGMRVFCKCTETKYSSEVKNLRFRLLDTGRRAYNPLSVFCMQFIVDLCMQ